MDVIVVGVGKKKEKGGDIGNGGLSKNEARNKNYGPLFLLPVCRATVRVGVRR